MMTTTAPLALGADRLWVLVTYRHAGSEIGTDAFRLAINPDSGCYCTCPPECFHTDALLPISRLTAEPLDGYRWATVTDTEQHAYPGATSYGPAA